MTGRLLVFVLQIDALSEVSQAVAGRAEVYLDGGVRRALSRGATAVFCGRPALWGLVHDVSETSPTGQHRWLWGCDVFRSAANCIGRH